MNETRDIIAPIHRSTTYQVTWDEAERLAQGDDSIPFYSRYGNPTVSAVEEQLAALCAPIGAVPKYSCVLSSSGMASISLVLLSLLQSGDEVLATDSIYGGTSKLLREVLPRFGIAARFTSCDLGDAEKSISPRTRMLWVESPANPLNRLVRFDDAVALSRKHGLISCIDATFGPPPLQKPLEHGFDLELHAATKYMGGHSDLLAGAIVGRHETVQPLRQMQRALGSVLDSEAAWLLGRGLHTLELRMARINESASAIAHYMSTHARVERVHYLGLESHRDHQAARAQMPGGFGGIVAFELKERTAAAAKRLTAGLKLIRHAPSLGGVETLISYPPLSSHAGQDDAQLQAAGITRGTLRLAIGLEPVESLIRDLESALEAV